MRASDEEMRSYIVESINGAYHAAGRVFPTFYFFSDSGNEDEIVCLPDDSMLESQNQFKRAINKCNIYASIKRPYAIAMVITGMVIPKLDDGVDPSTIDPREHPEAKHCILILFQKRNGDALINNAIIENNEIVSWLGWGKEVENRFNLFGFKELDIASEFVRAEKF